MLLKINKSKESHISKAFTIVELLVVIVIIGILAAITIVSYSGINRRAIAVSLTSDLSSDAKLLKLYNVDHSVYPDSIDTNYCPNAPETDSQYCLKASNGNELTYSGGGQSFVLTDTNTATNISYQITEDGIATIVEGGGGGSGVKTFANAWGGTGSDQFKSVVINSDGSYVLLGTAYSFSVDDENSAILISKYSSEGVILWSKIWGGTGEERAFSIIATNDGGYLAVGYTCSYGAGFGDAVLLKYDTDGNLQWNKTWGGTLANRGMDIAYSAVQSSDGNYVIVGMTESVGASESDGFILKASSTDGSTIWNKTWDGGYVDSYDSVIQQSDDTYIAVGRTNDEANGSDILITKFNADGSIAWNKAWGGTDLEAAAMKVIRLSSGGFAIAGYTDAYGNDNTDAYIAKFTADGTMIWDQTWGGVGREHAESIVQTSDGGFNIVGEEDDSFGRYTDAFIARFDKDGIYKWGKVFTGPSEDVAMDIVSTPDDGYLVVGHSNSFGSGSDDGLMLRYKSDGSMNYCSTTKCNSLEVSPQNPGGSFSSLSTSLYTPSATTSNPSATITTQNGTLVVVVPKYPYPSPTVTFSAKEMYIVYNGADETICKEWTVPSGKLIYGFYVNHAIEADYDSFKVSVDGVEKYDKWGLVADEYVDITSVPGTTLLACAEFNGGAQDGFSGEITGVYYK